MDHAAGKGPGEPPHRILSRFARTVYRTGLLDGVMEGDLFEAIRTIFRYSLDARSIHRLYAATHPDRVALVDDDRTLTYEEANEEIDRLVGALKQRFGATSGTPIAMMMENRVEYVAAWFGTFRIGASGVHVSYRSTADELEYQLEHSGARIVLCSETTREVALAVAGRHPDWNLKLVDVDAVEHHSDFYSYATLLQTARRKENGTRWSESAEGGSENIVYTSGTTGRPKGTVRDFTDLGLNDLFCIVERMPVEAGDRHLVVAPIYHSGGQVFTLLNASLGATIYLRPHFEPEDALRALSREKINSVFMVPTMIRRILELPTEVHDRYPTPELRVLVSGAAPFPEALRRAAMRRFGAKTVHDFYGATELGWVTLINGREMREKPGSVGRPIAGQEVRIVDDDGRECEPGQVGTIYVRSHHTMKGYLRDEEANREFRRDDWMTVEDLGFVDEDGYLYLAGRSRDMVITGGVNVYPVEIEDVLVDHPAVEDAGVVGVADEEWGEKLVAFVVRRNAEVDEDTLEEWAREHLAGYKIPRDWCFIDELPRNPTGKILKTELERRYSE